MKKMTYKYNGKTLAEFCEGEKLQILFHKGLVDSLDGEPYEKDYLFQDAITRKDEIVKREECGKVSILPDGRKRIFAQSKGKIFCASKEGDGIAVYILSKTKPKQQTLQLTGFLKFGEELKEGQKPADRFRHLLQGYSNKSMNLFFGNALDEYRFIYDSTNHGRRFPYRKEQTGILYDILCQQKREEESQYLLTEKEKELLALADTQIPALTWRETGFWRNALQQLSEDVYCLSGFSEINHKQTLASRIFIIREKGKVHLELFVRGLYADWIRGKKRDLSSFAKSKYDKFLLMSGEEGFLKYSIQKSEEIVAALLGSATNAFFEKMMHLTGLHKMTRGMSISGFAAYPKKESLEEAFGLSMGHLRAINAIGGKDLYCDTANRILRFIKTFVLSGKGKARRLNDQDFKKVLFLGMAFPDLAEFLVKRNKGAELYKKILCFSESYFQRSKEGLLYVAEAFSSEDGILAKYVSLKERVKKEAESFKVSLVQIEGNIWGYFWKDLFPNGIPSKDEDEKILDFLLKSSDGRLFTFTGEKEREDLLSFAKEVKAYSLEAIQSKLLLGTPPFKREKMGRNADPARIYRDLLSMAEIFSDEELDAMRVSLKFSSFEKIELMHDRLAKVYSTKKEGMADQKIASARERHLALEDSTTSEEFLTRLPESFSDLAKEGTELGHCVASYAGKINKGTSKIIFVRKKEEPDTPLCTVEVQKDVVTQIQGKHKTYPRRTSSGEDLEIYLFVQEWAKKRNFQMQV